MKKIGIITIYDEDNYGNRLQNYAVQQVLKSLNFDVETIRSKNIVDINEFYEKRERSNSKRLKKFLEFNNKYIINSKDIVIHKLVDEDFHEKYDYFVIGSDQIWNYNFDENFSNFSFASFAPSNKKISFSASFGISKIPQNEKKKYEYLKEIKAISVREDAGFNLVKELTGRDDTVVLVDPTMMLSKDEWSILAQKPCQLKSKKYILKYFLGNISEKYEDEIKRFAKENNCDIIDILDEDSFYETGPSEFLYLIKNSFFILTDSFHACIFSIIFNIPFLVFDRNFEMNFKNINMSSRIDALLSKFKLEERRFNGKITADDLNINYFSNNEILKREQETAISFLKNALEIE